MKLARALLGAALVLSGCASTPPRPAVPDRATLVRQLEDADLAFAKSTAERGVEGWLDFFAADGAQYDAKGQMTAGKEAIRKQMTPVFADVRLLWRPVHADVSAGGDLGFTYGLYEVKPKDKDETVARGAYLTVWRRAPDGSWKVLADMGSKDK